MIDGKEALTALAGDSAFAASAPPDRAAILVWDRHGESLLWSSDAARSLTRNLSAETDPLPASTRQRLKALANGLAPKKGLRLERLQFDPSGLAPPAIFACRMVQLASGSKVLVTARTGDTLKSSRFIAPQQNMAKPTTEKASPSQKRSITLRFVWQTDATGRFIEVSKELAETVGPLGGDILGRHWEEIVPSLHEPQSGAIARALQGRKTWSGLVVYWPLDKIGPEGQRRMIPIELSGTPKLERDRSIAGFRGFGLCRLNAEQEPAVEPLKSTSETETFQTEIPLEETTAGIAPPPQTVKDSNLKRSGLSEPERIAFREIARALAGNTLEGKDHSGHADWKEATFIGPRQPRNPSEKNRSEENRFSHPATVDTADEQALTSQNNLPAAPLAHPPMLPASEEYFPAPENRSPPRPSADELRVIDQWPEGVIVQQGGRIVFANRLLLDWLGYGIVDDFGGAGGVAHLFRVSPAIAPGDESGNRKETYPVLSTRDGRAIPVNIRLSSVTWGGKPASLMLVGRRNAEDDPPLRDYEPENGADTASMAQPEQSAERIQELEAILDTAADGVIVLGETGRILSLNRSAEALFGYRRDEVVDQAITCLLAAESHIVALDYLEGLRSNGIASLLNGREITGRVKQGGTIPLFMTMGKIKDGPARKFCTVLKDLSSFKKAEAELMAAKSTAETANAQKSELLARISHEIRTPLNAIIGFAEVMMEERFGSIGNPRYKDYLNDMHASGGHVLSLVNDLLDLAKIEAGKMELSLTSVALNSLVASCIALVQPQAARSRVVIRTGYFKRLPPIVADERSMRQIVLNLLSNAIKFTEAGGQIIVSTALTDFGEAAIRVRDTGIGMNDAEIREALEPFRQLATSRRKGGTGLGLPLTKALVEANRGRLHISSTQGQGTLVEILFPPTRVLAE